ncbi:MAG: Wadjet anti-phage system protein JetD domain-containing protein [Saprospiraceae bacterium]
MITLEELHKKALNLYPEVLRSTRTGEVFFPKTIPANKQPGTDLAALHRQVVPLVAASKEQAGLGYTIRYEQRKTRLHGIQDLPTAFVFETRDDYLYFLKKTEEFAQFERDATSIAQHFPALADWIETHPLQVVEYAGRWGDLLAVCQWFVTTWVPDRYYLRELTVPVHTKFVEQHKGILTRLLDVLLGERVNVAENSFEQRFHLRYDEPLVRIRLLDAVMPGFRDVSLPVSAFRTAHFPVRRVFVLENKMNFLAFPAVPEAAAIWGKGFQVSILKNIDWLARAEIFYWGDLDAQGLQILSQWRGYYPHTQALLMDRKTLLRFQRDWVAGTPTTATRLPGLSAEEHSLFDFLKENNQRLEQEKIPQDWLMAAL